MGTAKKKADGPMGVANDSKYQPPESVSKHKKLYTHAKKLIATAEHSLDTGYQEAVDKHLRDDKGLIDYKLLDNADVQKKFTDTMIDMYHKAAIKHFKISKDLDEMERNILQRAYLGTSAVELRTLVDRFGKKFDRAQFDDYKTRGVRAVTSQLYDAASAHIEDKDAKDVVKHVGLEDIVGVPENVTAVEAGQLLRVFHEEGSVSDNALRQILPSYKRKGKKKKAPSGSPNDGNYATSEKAA
jgi:hypothetical protein